jgi:outer membrane protein, heavy metal efflux system
LLEDIMKKIFLVACLALSNAAHAQSERSAQPSEPSSALTMKAALALARAQNSELAALRNEIEATDGAAQQSRTIPNPVLTSTWEEVGKPGRSTSLEISQLVETGGKRAARVRAAGLGRDIATAEYDVKRIDVMTRVRQAFVDVLAAQRRKQISDQAVALAAQAADAVGKRVAAGKVSPVEETKAKLEAGAARIEAEQAARELASARKRLSAFWGNATPRFSEASGDLELLVTVPSLDTLEQRARSSPERVRAIAEVARRSALLDGEKAKRYPDFTLGAGLKRTLDTRENLPLFTISMPLPIFDRNQGSVREALKRVDKARDEQSTIDTRLQSELGQTYERFKAIEMELTTLREELLPGAKSAFDAATTGYQLGKFGFLDALDAQRTLFRTNQQYVKALTEYHRTIADLERLTGEPLNAERAAMMNIE